jgi:hypothetical protein
MTTRISTPAPLTGRRIRPKSSLPSCSAAICVGVDHGVARVHAPHQFGQQARQHRRHEGHAQCADLAARRKPCGLFRARCLMERRARLGKKHHARFAQSYPMAIAFEQPHAQILFERLDLHAQRGLHDAQTLGGAAEMQFFRERYEGAQVFEFHDLSRGVWLGYHAS